MKTFYILFLTLPLLCLTQPTGDKQPLQSDTTIVVEDSDHAESESSQISKRSGGSFDIVNHLKTGLLSSVGRASASIASGSSGGFKTVEINHHNSVDFDPWTLKKSVLNTLFQAVKAITGGVTAIKGQLIKGSGYALSAGGKLVAASGDKVTDVGKAIVHSAQLVPSHPIQHPLTKFSSLSSLSSSSISGASKGSIPLSSSGSAGPVTHSETITTYEIPSGHASYGPPSKPPSYSGPAATHQYLPPGTYSGAGAPFSGAVAFEGAPSSYGYLPSNKYGVPMFDGGINGYSQYGSQLSTRDVKSAEKALKEIIHLLPTSDTKIQQLQQTEQFIDHDPVVEQYPIPSDPIPDIKIPILGPIGAISHTETITTAFGTPFKKSSSSSYASVPSADSTDVIEEIDFDNHGHPSPMYNPHAYDVYHTLTVKKHKTNNKDQLQSSSIPFPTKTITTSTLTNPNKKNVVNHHYKTNSISSINFDPRPQLRPNLPQIPTTSSTSSLSSSSNNKQNYFLTYLNSFPTQQTTKTPPIQISNFYNQHGHGQFSHNHGHGQSLQISPPQIRSDRRRHPTKRHVTKSNSNCSHLHKIQKALHLNRLLQQY